jgi:hypothetical protein
MPQSSSDLINWRAFYPAPPVSPRPAYPFNSRGQSLEGMGAINRMPFVFDPQAFSGMSTEDMWNWILPGGRRKINLRSPMTQGELTALNDLHAQTGPLPRSNWQNFYPPQQMNLFQYPFPPPATQTQNLQFAGTPPGGTPPGGGFGGGLLGGGMPPPAGTPGAPMPPAGDGPFANFGGPGQFSSPLATAMGREPPFASGTNSTVGLAGSGIPPTGLLGQAPSAPGPFANFGGPGQFSSPLAAAMGRELTPQELSSISNGLLGSR